MVTVAFGSLKDNRRAHGVDLHPLHGVGTHKGHLKGGEVDNVGDAIVCHRLFKHLKIGDVTADHGDLCQLVGIHDQLQTVLTARQIVGPNRHTLIDQPFHRPCTDTTQSTTD